jgi:hypothetical protein
MRRALLAAAAWAAGWQGRGALAQAPAAPPLQVVPVPVPLAHITPEGAHTLVAVSTTGTLLRGPAADGTWQSLGQGLDPGTPAAVGHGRIAARSAEGGLWLHEGGRATLSPGLALAPAAGLLVLPLAVIAVQLWRGAAHLVRLEPEGSGRWAVVARSAEPVLPDARPLQVDLDGRGDGGHIVVLAGPDTQRYTHGVLGDAVEATQVLWLERHSLQPLRSLLLPSPWVLEDIAPRVLGLAGGGTGLISVRAGPEGGQLVLLVADPAGSDRIVLQALGDPVGGRHRWLAPSTDGRTLLAVHTPHIGGVLHRYTVQDGQLPRERLMGGVSTHRIGSRETDLALWQRGSLLLPTQDRRTLLRWDPAAAGAGSAAGAAGTARWPLPAPLAASRAAPEGAPGWLLLEDGRLLRAPEQTLERK